MATKNYLITLIGLILIVSSCKKEFLDKKPDDSLVLPKTLDEFQALLDNEFYMNGTDGNGGLTPPLGDVGSDDYFLLDADYNSRSDFNKNLYIWNKSIYTGATTEAESWSRAYRTIYYANIVLDGLEKLNPIDLQKFNNVKGSALFFRAHSYWHLAQVFCPTYDKDLAKSSLGLPLRFRADINEKIERSTLEATYLQIIKDLTEAKDLLPDAPAFKTRPSKNAAFGLLAKTYLSMSDYENALTYSDLSLKLNNYLLDYKTITGTSTTATVIPPFNNEIVFFASQLFGTAESSNVGVTVAKVDTGLYALYETNDLRKKYFFRDRATVLGLQHSYRGSYMNGLFVTGIVNDEIYLIRAECFARKGDVVNAMKDLNSLLKNRYTSFTELNIADKDAALLKILTERRKELLFRGVRWSDLKRLNKEPAFAKKLQRVVNGVTFELLPNDKRYIYPLPLQVISFNPNMPQNER